MLTKAKRISSKIVAALCAATLLLGIFVLSTSAQEPTERVSTEGYIPSDIVTTKRIIFTTGRVAIKANIDPTQALSVNGYMVHYSYVACRFTINEHGDSYTFITPPIPIKSIIDNEVELSNAGLTLYEIPIYAEGTNEQYGTVRINLSTWEWDSYIQEATGSTVSFWDYLVYDVGGNADEAYQSGYNQGFYEGEEEGYSQGYSNGLSQGYDNGYEEGYSNGYDTASSQIENSNYIKDLGEGFFNGLLDIFIVVEDFEVFGTKLGDIIGYIITAIIVLLLVKVVAFVV